MNRNICFSMHWYSLRDAVINVSHLAQAHLHSLDMFLRGAIISLKFMSSFTNISYERTPLKVLWDCSHQCEPGLKDLIINTDLWKLSNKLGVVVVQTMGVEWSTFFLWVWWCASLKMTQCKNCLEDLIKYVWNWVFKEGIDREIHHCIVKFRNTIKVWIFSIIFFLLLCRVLQTKEHWKHDFNITCDFQAKLFFPSLVWIH